MVNVDANTTNVGEKFFTFLDICTSIQKNQSARLVFELKC